MKNLKNRIVALAVGTLVAGLSIVGAYLFAPPPQRASAQFFAQQTYAGSSTHVSNAYSITLANYGSLLSGVPIQFIPDADNTGPATLNVSGLGAVVVQRPSSLGLVGLSGAELKNGVLTTVVYNGTNFQLVAPLDMRPIGDTIEFRGSTTPPGYLIEDGTAVSRTTYAALFTAIGTTYGVGDGSTTFNLPDSRGTFFLALDNQGGSAANRVTTGGSGCNATATSSTICGLQTHTLTAAQLPTLTSTNASQSITVYPGGASTNQVPQTPSSNPWVESSATSGGAFIGPSRATSGGMVSQNSFSAPNSISVTSTGTSGSAHPILNPTLLGRRAIKY